MSLDDQQFIPIPRAPMAWGRANDLALAFAKLASQRTRVDMCADMVHNVARYQVTVARELAEWVRSAGLDRYHILDLFLAELRRDMIRREGQW